MPTNTTSPKGILAGGNPIVFNSANPLPLFIVQVFIIIVLCQALTWVLRKFRQPRVIAEVLVGIILGPSLMGRIPGFSDMLFPKSSLPFINLAANFGLVLFLFLVGVELDPRMLRLNAKHSLSVSVAGMALPFVTGIAVSYGLYKVQNTPEIPFSTFLIFIGVAVSITAFPVLARILAELKLMRTDVGAIAISAGLINDCTAWVLLAIVVALINASSGIVALYVFLMAIGWTLILVFLVGPLFKKFCIAQEALKNGPTPLTMAVLLILVLLSAFVTDMIGIHVVFGGFLAGVIVPHDHSFAIHVTEKIEDIISIIFLPLYFALSGLNTQIGLLNNGVVWGYVFLVIAVACVGKVVGCTVASRISGLDWRKSLTVGFLMNCKGLVELIVLNIGHDAKVINDQIFVIMVVMALVTTVMTTPIVMILHPTKDQDRNQGNRHLTDTEMCTITPVDKRSDQNAFNLVVCLNRLEHVPSLMILAQMLNNNSSLSKAAKYRLEIHAIRLVKLTQRTSAVMMTMTPQSEEDKKSEEEDPIVNVFRTFALLNSIGINCDVSITPVEEFAANIGDKATKLGSDMVLLPMDGRTTAHDSLNPFEHLLVSDSTGAEWSPHFLIGVIRLARSFAVGLFLDRGFGVLRIAEKSGSPDNTVSMSREMDITTENIGASPNGIDAPPYVRYHQIFVPFLGGPDDREALKFAFKLSRHPTVKLTVLHFTLPANHSSQFASAVNQSLQATPLDETKGQPLTPGSFYDTLTSAQSTIVGPKQSWMESATQDQNLLTKLLNESKAYENENVGQLPVHVDEIVTDRPLLIASEHARGSLTSKDLVIVGRKGWPTDIQTELFGIFAESKAPEEAHPHRNTKGSSNSDMRKVFGDVAYGLISTGVKASLLVVQGKREDD